VGLFTPIREKQTRKYLAREAGGDEKLAAAAARAMLPFDNDLEPDKGMRKAINRVARRFAFATKRCTTEELRQMTREALRYYVDAATYFGDTVYARKFRQALLSTRQPGETDVDILGADEPG
jgi:hypothetical protein